MRISDWSSDVCSSDLYRGPLIQGGGFAWFQNAGDPAHLLRIVDLRQDDAVGRRRRLGEAEEVAQTFLATRAVDPQQAADRPLRPAGKETGRGARRESGWQFR